MDIRAPVSRIERAVRRVETGVCGVGRRALEWRRASLAVERDLVAVGGEVWRAWRRVERSLGRFGDGEEEEEESVADGMLRTSSR